MRLAQFRDKFQQDYNVEGLVVIPKWKGLLLKIMVSQKLKPVTPLAYVLFLSELSNVSDMLSVEVQIHCMFSLLPVGFSWVYAQY